MLTLLTLLPLMQMALTGAAFSQCTACSPAVVGALRAGGWPWLLSALRVRPMQTRTAYASLGRLLSGPQGQAHGRWLLRGHVAGPGWGRSCLLRN